MGSLERRRRSIEVALKFWADRTVSPEVNEASGLLLGVQPIAEFPVALKAVGGEIYASHWSEVDMSAWPWPNFSPREFASKGNGAVRVHVDAANKLQALRALWGGPLRINSAYRDPVYNERVGGAKLSQHKKGRAFDISVRGFTAEERARLVRLAAEVGFTGFGGYNTFLHVDNARPRRWGQAWGHPK